MKNSMQKALEALALAPKCGAYSRRSRQPCKNAQMPNGKCRMHGGKSTGRPIITGLHTNAAKADRRNVRQTIKRTGEIIEALMANNADPDELLERLRTYEAL